MLPYYNNKYNKFCCVWLTHHCIFIHLSLEPNSPMWSVVCEALQLNFLLATSKDMVVFNNFFIGEYEKAVEGRGRVPFLCTDFVWNEWLETSVTRSYPWTDVWTRDLRYMKQKFHHQMTITYYPLSFWVSSWLLLPDPAHQWLSSELDSNTCHLIWRRYHFAVILSTIYL